MEKYMLVYGGGNSHALIVNGFEIATVYTYKDDYLQELKMLIADAKRSGELLKENTKLKELLKQQLENK